MEKDFDRARLCSRPSAYARLILFFAFPEFASNTWMAVARASMASMLWSGAYLTIEV
jgi:hypothetical protein